MSRYCRAAMLGQYIADTGATVRATAAEFGVSKSTVHKDVTVQLPLEDAELAQKVQVILEKNKAERHLRGGMATRLMYLRRKS